MKIFNDIYVTFYCEIVENKFQIYRKSLSGKYIFINNIVVYTIMQIVG